MNLKIYQVDAFADKVFQGNPAAVIPLETWLDDKILQNIAAENNLAETAFYIKTENGIELRWFTPTIEVDLCGHATLAAAYVLFHHEGHMGEHIEFLSRRSGILKVSKVASQLTLDFPADELQEVLLTDDLTSGFNIMPILAFKGKSDYMLIYNNQKEIESILPNLYEVNKVEARGIIVTAPGDEVDFVSRFFAPQAGVPEDPVTGSAHTTLTPYWSEKLGKQELDALQLSKRVGLLQCKIDDDRVLISGQATLYLKGEITI